MPRLPLNKMPERIDSDWINQAQELVNDLTLWSQRFSFGQIEIEKFDYLSKAHKLSFLPRELQINEWLLKLAPTSSILDDVFLCMETQKKRTRQEMEDHYEATILKAAYESFDYFLDEELCSLKKVAEVVSTYRGHRVAPKQVARVLRNFGIETSRQKDGTKILSKRGTIVQALKKLGIPTGDFPEERTPRKKEQSDESGEEDAGNSGGVR